MHVYRAFGVNIRSEIPISHLNESSFDSADVSIRVGEVGYHPPSNNPGDDSTFLIQDGDAILHWPGVATFRVCGTEEVVVAPCAEAPDELVGLAVTGPPIGVVLQRRGNLVLHGSAVVIEGSAVAFLGPKGMGKSTTAAALHRSGHPMLTDDILSIDTSCIPKTAFPGAPVIKLWPSAEEALFQDGMTHEPLLATDKAVRKMPEAYAGHPAPLEACFILDAGDTGVERVVGREAFLGILQNSYASRFLGTEGTPPELFMQCADVARSVSTFRLLRRPSLETLPDIVALVEDTVRDERSRSR